MLSVLVLSFIILFDILVSSKYLVSLSLSLHIKCVLGNLSYIVLSMFTVVVLGPRAYSVSSVGHTAWDLCMNLAERNQSAVSIALRWFYFCLKWLCD